MEIPSLPPCNRVPGETKIKQKEYVLDKDLTKLSRRDLLDLKERQLKMLENKSWIKKLPDKGEKIQKLYDRVIEALEKKQEIDCAADLLKNLHLESKDISNLEWEGTRATLKQQLDSDDDEDPDPIAVLLSTNSVASSKKIFKHEQPEQSLITSEDLKEAEEIKNGHLHLDPVLEHMCQNEKHEPEFRFLPYKNAKLREHPGEHKIRDNSSATPPVITHVTKTLTLRQSMEAENQSRTITKEVTEKHAAERLEAKMKELKVHEIATIPNPSAPSMTKYRLPCDNPEDDEVNDSDESFESALSDDMEE